MLETTDRLQVGSLPAQLVAATAAADPPARAVSSLADTERQAIHDALEAVDHDVNEAARALGISRATLYRKLKKHDLPVRP